MLSLLYIDVDSCQKLVLGIGFSFLVLYNVWSAIDSPLLRLELIKEYMEFKLGLSLYLYYYSMAVYTLYNHPVTCQ
jgi:hypothetical protein